MNPDFGYLFGMYLGDGCVYYSNNKPVFQLRGIDRDIIQHTANISNHYFHTDLNPFKIDSESKNLWGIFGRNIGFCDLLLDACEKDPKVFPKWFHSQSRPFRVELLAGLLDTDGYTSFRKKPKAQTKTNEFQIQAGFCSTSDWISEVKKLAEDLEIRVGKIHLKSDGQKNGHKGKKPVYAINLRVSDFIEKQCFFRCQRKQARIIKYANSYSLEYPHRPYVKHHLLTQM